MAETYATTKQVECGFRELSETECKKCKALLEEAAVLIDAAAPNADVTAKQVVSCRIVRRALGDGMTNTSTVPMGATQGSFSGLGYSQSWTMASGSSGELYLGKTERQILRVSNRIGVTDPYGEPL